MALNAYMKFTGETMGEIKGSVTQAGREDSIEIIAVNHLVRALKKTPSKSVQRKFKHEPFFVTKEIDRSTPLLLKALCENEKAELEFRFWKPTPSGKEKQYYTIYLFGVYILSIELEMLNNKYPENMQHKEREHISFNYNKIKWVFEDEGIEAEAEKGVK